MSLQSVVNDFVELQKKEKGDRTYETYGRKIYVFQEYLEKRGVDDTEYRAFLYRANKDVILSSIRYYVETYDISYKSTTDSFFAALTVFFYYIQDKLGIKNDYFAVNDKAKELKDAYNQLAKELKLNTKEQAVPLTYDEYTKLKDLCDEKINSPSDDEILQGKNNGVYSSYISSLVTKFVMIYGCKNKVLSEIMIDDYDYELNKITIRGYSVHLPDKLARQMRRYTKIREEICSSSKENRRLFVDITLSSKWENSKMFFVLKSVTGNTKATSVAKYAIVQMLKNGMPLNIVMDFTGYSKNVYGHCQEIIDDENGIFKLDEKNRKLDSTIRQSQSFDDL